MTDPLDLLDGAVQLPKTRMTALEIAQLRRAGMKTRDIAKRLGTSAATIRGLMCRAGVSLRRPASDTAEMLAKYARGAPVTSIAREYGLTVGGLISAAWRSGARRPQVDGKPRRHHLPVGRVREVLRLRYRPLEDIVAATGCAPRTVQRWLRREYGIDKPTLAAARRIMRYARICAMYAKDLPNKIIQCRVGCGSRTIYKALEEMGVERRKLTTLFIDDGERDDLNFKVYRLSWPDGATYIGVTSGKIQARLIRHRYDCARGGNPNEEFCRRIRGDFAVEVLSRHATNLEAIDAERVAIAGEAKTLNAAHVDRARQEVLAPPRMPRGNGYRRRKRGPFPRVEGRDYRCRYCGETKPAGHFHSDCRRSCGIASKCRACANELRARLGRRGETPSNVIYAEFVEEKRRAQA